LHETPDGFLVESQFLPQTVAFHANEPLAVPQIVDFDGDFEENKVRVFETLVERFDSPHHKQWWGLFCVPCSIINLEVKVLSYSNASRGM
jgi:hypothetical protein